jgi:hypothetical protein
MWDVTLEMLSEDNYEWKVKGDNGKRNTRLVEARSFSSRQLVVCRVKRPSRNPVALVGFVSPLPFRQ